MFIDSHCHLDDSDFAADREAVIARALDAGVGVMVNIGGASGPDEMDSALRIAGNHEGIYAAAGIHPHEASKAADKHFDQLREWAGRPKFLAIGEIGLDYHYDRSPRDVQRIIFIRQLELAREAGMPIMIHCREAWTDLAEIIQSHWRSSALGGVLHCFGGEREDAFKFIDWGFLVSFAGNVTFKNAQNLRDVARQIPIDRLLTETDCPYLAPVPHRGKRNEPALVVETTRALAALHNLSGEEMGAKTLENFRRFFRLSFPSPDPHPIGAANA